MLIPGEGIILDEPSVVAVNTRTEKVLAVGSEAKEMIGRTPSHVQAARPLRDGVIADFDMCEEMLRAFIRRVHRRRWIKPRMVIAVPSGITGVEQRAVQEAAEFAGAHKPVKIIEEPMAAAIGAGMRVWEPVGNMIVDIGGGTTEVAVISLGGIVASKSSRVGGDIFDKAIVDYIKKEFALEVGERTAEEIKFELGSAYPLAHEQQAEVRGVDMATGLPRVVTVTSMDIRVGLEETLNDVSDSIRATLDDTPPELAADIIRNGIVLAGGGALLRGLDQRLADDTGMPIRIADDPLYAVVRGSGRMLENLAHLPETLFRSDGT